MRVKKHFQKKVCEENLTSKALVRTFRINSIVMLL